MGKDLVTQGQWQAVTATNPNDSSSCWARCPVEMGTWDNIRLTDGFIEKSQHLSLTAGGGWEAQAADGGGVGTGAARGGADAVVVRGCFRLRRRLRGVLLGAPVRLVAREFRLHEPTRGDEAGQSVRTLLHGREQIRVVPGLVQRPWTGSSPQTNPNGSSPGSYRVARGGSGAPTCRATTPPGAMAASRRAATTTAGSASPGHSDAWRCYPLATCSGRVLQELPYRWSGQHQNVDR